MGKWSKWTFGGLFWGFKVSRSTCAVCLRFNSNRTRRSHFSLKMSFGYGNCVALSFCCIVLPSLALSFYKLQVMCWSGALIMHRVGGLLYLWWLYGEGRHIWASVGAPLSFGFPELWNAMTPVVLLVCPLFPSAATLQLLQPLLSSQNVTTGVMTVTWVKAMLSIIVFLNTWQFGLRILGTLTCYIHCLENCSRLPYFRGMWSHWRSIQ